MRRFRAMVIGCLVLSIVIVVNSELALASTALIVTPRTSITQADLQSLTCSLRLSLQERGITLAPEISAALGSLQAAQYVTFSSSPKEIEAATKGIGVNYIVLVDIQKHVEHGLGWSFWDFVLLVPWLWHPCGFYDYAEVGAQVCVFNSQGTRIFYKAYNKRRKGLSLLLGLLGGSVARALGRLQHTLFLGAASALADAISNDISIYLRR